MPAIIVTQEQNCPIFNSKLTVLFCGNTGVSNRNITKNKKAIAYFTMAFSDLQMLVFICPTIV